MAITGSASEDMTPGAQIPHKATKPLRSQCIKLTARVKRFPIQMCATTPSHDELSSSCGDCCSVSYRPPNAAVVSTEDFHRAHAVDRRR